MPKTSESHSNRSAAEARDWEAAYQSHETPWDKGRPHPALLEWLSRNRLTGRILVPGCGAGHDVCALAADTAATVIGLDIAPSAAAAAARLSPPDNTCFLTEDYLALGAGEGILAGSFDAVFEHTCFCAIPPARRPDYVRSTSAVLKKGGLFVAIIYRNPSDRAEEGPPFGCSMEEVDVLFDGRFVLLEEITELPTFEGREGREVLRVMRAV